MNYFYYFRVLWHKSQLYMDKTHPLNIPIQVHLLDMKEYIFWPRDDNEELLSPKVRYLIAIGALMYLVNNTRPNIAFLVN